MTQHTRLNPRSGVRGALGRAARVSAAAAVGAMLLGTVAEAQTIRAVLHSALRVLDPIITTAYITRDHGYMIYDTLVATDANFEVQPQMASWEISEDKLTYTFTLRDGLKFHDGAPVTAEDVIASLKRWGERDGMGQKLMDFVADMKADGDKVMVMTLKEPYGLVLESLGKPSSIVPFIMPKRMAETPSTEAVSEQIGSGPFRFVADEFQPGLISVYEKFEDYVPRDEPPSWAAGGKVVNVDRVEFVVMPDAQTTLSALQSGEVDFWEDPKPDLLPILRSNDELVVKNLNALGLQTIMRPNFLHPPMDNKLIRQAAMAAFNQQDFMDAKIGDPELFQLCGAMFVCGTPLETDVGSEEVVNGTGMEHARALLKEAGYDGTPVVIMHPTDVGSLSTQPVVAAQAMRDAGFVVDLQAMDWQTLVGRRASQAPVSEGGWNMFFTNWVSADINNPINNNMVNGRGPNDGGWFGWPTVPEAEELRDAYARSTDPAEQKEIATKLQTLAYDEVMYVPLGQYIEPSAWSTRLDGVVEGPATPYFWNVTKK
ncbi:ABC transporter substrate-binding protein [Pikeienuella sp. HZG-20]|uniref:ABC transporter substrate-binding protein n=1 Tax=Paludibacillus litoralis TaxID=3133267 RepID=UPI0030EDE87C